MNMPVVSSRLFMGILLVTALLALVIVTNGSAQAQTPSTEDCASSHAICTAEGRPLSNRLELTVAGPGG